MVYIENPNDFYSFPKKRVETHPFYLIDVGALLTGGGLLESDRLVMPPTLLSVLMTVTVSSGRRGLSLLLLRHFFAVKSQL